MLSHLPSLAALESDDDRLGAELRLARLRSQVAVVRTVADEVEHLAQRGDADGLRAQLVVRIEMTEATVSNRGPSCRRGVQGARVRRHTRC